MDKPEKKRLKAEAKREKKQAKASVKSSENRNPTSAAPETTSSAVRFAEAVRGILYLIFGVTLILAVILQEKGMLLSLDKIIENLIVIRAGQVTLIIIALAMFIYGLKHLRIVK